MIENFEAVISANIRDFQRSLREVDQTIRETAMGADAMIGADIHEFMSEAAAVQTITQEITSGNNSVTVDATIREFLSDMAVVEATTAEITHGDHDVEIDADIGGFLRGAARVRAQAMELARDRIVIPINTRWNNYKNTMGQIANFSRSLGEIGAMTAGGIKIAMSPAIVPVLASVVGLVGQLGPMLGTVAGSTFALGSAFGTAGIGAAAFGAIAVTNLKDIFGASEELKKLDEKLAAADGWKERQKIMEDIKRVQGSLNDEQTKGLTAMNDLKSTWSGIAGALQAQTIQIFTSALGIMSGVLTNLKPMFTGVMDAATNLTAALGKSINAEPMQNFFKYLNTTAGPMLETMGKAVGNFVQGFLNMMTAFGPLATETAGSFLKMSESFAAWGASLSKNQQFQSFVSYVSENMPKIRSIVGDAIVGIINTFAAFGPSSSDMMTGLQNLMERFRNFSSTLSQNQGFQNFINYVKTNGPVVVSTIGNIVTFITNLGIALAPLGAKMLGIVNSFLSWTNGMMQSHPIIGKIIAGAVLLGGTFLALMPHIIGIATLFVGLPAAMQVAAFGMIKTAAVFVAKWALIGVQSLLGAARVAAAWFIALGPIGWVTAAIIGIVALVIANWDKVSAWTSKAWSAITSFVVNAVSKIAGWIQNKFPALYNVIASYMNMAKSIISAVWNGIKGTFSNVLSFLKALVKGDFQGIKNAVQSQMQLVQSTIQRIWGAIKSYLSTLLGTLVSTFGSMFGKIVSTIRTKVSEAVSALRSKVGEMPGIVRGFTGAMLSAGGDLVRGMINGIKNMGSAAVEAISGVVGGVISKAKSLLNINSPSRVFRDFGGFVSEGLAIGVDQRAKMAVSSVANMAAAMTGAFNPQLEMANMRAAAHLDTSVNRADMGVVRKSFAAEISNDRQPDVPMPDIVIQIDGKEVGRQTWKTVDENITRHRRVMDMFRGK